MEKGEVVNCPLCLDAPLEPKFVGPTEVDICTRCRGIWLDRGELDRLLDQPSRDQRPAPSRVDDRYDDRRKGKKKKSKSQRLADLFEEVLDF